MVLFHPIKLSTGQSGIFWLLLTSASPFPPHIPHSTDTDGQRVMDL